MEIDQYQAFSETTAQYFKDRDGLLYPLLGLAGEIGELIEKIVPVLSAKIEAMPPSEEASRTLGIIYQLESIAVISKGLEKTKKAIRKGDINIVGLQASTIVEIPGVIDELGDIYWYINQLALRAGILSSEILQRNIDKLTSRKERNVIKEEGDTR